MEDQMKEDYAVTYQLGAARRTKYCDSLGEAVEVAADLANLEDPFINTIRILNWKANRKGEWAWRKV
jgi:hypothetical protein